MAFKERVKCANCGMIYDRAINDILPDDGGAQCPCCKSNAYDRLNKEEWTRQ